MLGMPSFVTIDRSIHELFSENPRSPKTRKSVAIRDAVSDHSALVEIETDRTKGTSKEGIDPANEGRVQIH